MMYGLLLVGAGGAAGSILRYLCQRLFNLPSFPLGTMTVNIAGCFLIGILWALLAKHIMSDNMRLLFVTGFCGGFTTFSAFTQEGNELLMEGKLGTFLLYSSLSFVGGMVATFFGYKLFI